MMFDDDDAPNFDYDSEEENRIAQEMNELGNIGSKIVSSSEPSEPFKDINEINNSLLNNNGGSNKKIKLSETTNSVLSEINTPQRTNPNPERAFHYGNKDKTANRPVVETPSYLNKRFQDSSEFKYLNVLLPSGKDIKLKMHLKEPVILKYDLDDEHHKSNSFLSKSIQQLKLEIAKEEEQKRKHSIEEIQSDSYSVEPRDNSKSEVDLWVEKFRPKDYFELLSDDGTNRLILTWIKTWDYFVFGKEVEKDKHDAAKNRAAGGLSTGGKETPNSSKKRKRLVEDEMAEKLLELDELNRPKLKVALVSGPPGLGKTTLAQIISKRAGYNCIEMNASDDRNPEAFRQYIEAVTQIRGTVNDVNMKPNCLILDEIDGAPQNAIQVLIDHIAETKKGKSKEVKRCLRPIICICNDLYTPALKQLRQVSIVFQCQAVTTHRLAERLRSICTMTKMEAEIDGLIALCDKTSNDIRSCLNTLQFLSRRTNKITVKLVSELNVGQKDMEKSIFTIMNEIFFKKFDKKDKLSDEKSKINSIINMCQNCDLDRLIQALFENFLFIRFRDSNFEMVQKAEEWTMFSDRLNRQIRQNQDYSFMGYQKHLPVLFHLLFSSTSLQINSQNKKFAYPHVLFDHEMKQSKNKRITTGFLNEMSSSARVYHNSNSHSIMDLLPYLTQILQMNIRPVAIQLLSKNEKERFDALVNLMILFNLNYRQEKTTEGQFGFVLDPPIDELIKLSGMKQHKQLPNMVRQQISREITITRVKLMDKSKDSGQNESNKNGPVAANKAKAMFNLKNLDQISKEKESDKLKKPTPNSNAIDKPPVKEKVGLHSFFQRSKDTDKAKNTQAKVKEENKGRKYNDGVWLKYKEGFINAVKYNIKINQLL